MHWTKRIYPSFLGAAIGAGLMSLILGHDVGIIAFVFAWVVGTLLP